MKTISDADLFDKDDFISDKRTLSLGIGSYSVSVDMDCDFPDQIDVHIDDTYSDDSVSLVLTPEAFDHLRCLFNRASSAYTDMQSRIVQALAQDLSS